MPDSPSSSPRNNRGLVIACAALSVTVLLLVIAVIRLGALAEPAQAEHAPVPSGQVQGIDGSAALGGFVENSSAPQLTIVRLHDGQHRGTQSERYARPALSLAKLYIADYVLDHGSKDQQWEAIQMIADSNDASAEDLYAAYPEAIDRTAKKYGLLSTRSGKDWGYALTSTYDVAQFLATLLDRDPTSPILVAMSRADKVAADGYAQDWGTARIPRVIGSKWGWSNAKDLHSSVSFSEDYVVAAAVTGSKEDLTDFVGERLEGLGGWLGDDTFDRKPTETTKVAEASRRTTPAEASRGAPGQVEAPRG